MSTAKHPEDEPANPATTSTDTVLATVATDIEVADAAAQESLTAGAVTLVGSATAGRAESSAQLAVATTTPSPNKLTTRGSRSLAKNAGIVSFYTMLSRVTGLARDTIFGHIFGAGFETDAFVMAFTIPNAFRSLVAEGALTVAFLPVFKQAEKEGGDEAVRRLMGQALGVFPLLASLVCLAAMILATPLVFMFANGFHAIPGKFELTVTLTRWMFPYLALVSFVALTMGALNARAYFASSSASQLIFNSVHICVILFFARLIDPPMLGVSCGVLAGGVAQVIVQIVALRQADLWVRPRIVFGPEIKRILKLMGPAVVSLAIYQVNIAASRSYTSFLDEGAVTFLYNADRFFQLPLGVFAIAIATASLPALSEALTTGGNGKLTATFRQSVQLNNFITIPSAVGLVVLALPITATISHHGNFTHDMSVATAEALIWLAVGLVAVSNIRVAGQVFFALQDTKTPVICGIVGLFANLALIPFFALRYDFRGLPMSISASAWIQLCVQLWLLSRRAGRLGVVPIIGRALRDLVASAIMGAAAWYVALYGRWELGFSMSNALVLLAAVTAGGVAYGLAQTLFRADELVAVRNRLLRRRRART